MRKTLMYLAIAGLCVSFVPAEDEVKIAVMDVKARQGVDNMVALSLTDLVCTEIADFGGFQVIGRDDMQAMLEHIGDRQLLECDDTKCLAKVGGALGVEQLMAGNIGMIGKTYLINFKLIDIDGAEVLNRVSQEFTGEESGLIPFVRHSVNVLFGKAAADAVVTASVPVAAPAMLPLQSQTGQPEKKDSKVLKVFRYSLFGIGLLTAVGAVVTKGGADKMFDEEYNTSMNTEDADGYRDEVEQQDARANMLLGISIGSLLGGGISFAF